MPHTLLNWPASARNVGMRSEIAVRSRWRPIYCFNTAGGVAGAVQRLDTILPQRCREHVQARFDVGQMVDGYVAMYERMLFRLRRRAPTVVRPGFRPKAVEPYGGRTW